MKKIKLMFKDIFLGEYYFADNYYFFEENNNALQEMMKNYKTAYNVKRFDTLTPKSTEIFGLLKNMVNDIKQREDLKFLLKLDGNESDFEIVYRYAKCPQSHFDFYTCI